MGRWSQVFWGEFKKWNILTEKACRKINITKLKPNTIILMKLVNRHPRHGNILREKKKRKFGPTFDNMNFGISRILRQLSYGIWAWLYYSLLKNSVFSTHVKWRYCQTSVRLGWLQIFNNQHGTIKTKHSTNKICNRKHFHILKNLPV